MKAAMVMTTGNASDKDGDDGGGNENADEDGWWRTKCLDRTLGMGRGRGDERGGLR